MIKKLGILFTFLVTLNGCTRDDICDENTATTPLLIITFKDSNNPLVAKEVSNLIVTTADTNNTEVVTIATTDSIAIPLKTAMNLTSYLFSKDADSETPNPDSLNFTYERENIYVNRACGFKTHYKNLATEVENEGVENWILSYEVLKTTVENETEAHITIFH